MKKFFYLFALLLCGLAAYTQHGVTILPQKPQPGDTVIITYDAPRTADTPVIAFTYSNFYTFPRTIQMQWRDNQWFTSFTLPPYAVLANFVIEAGDSTIQPSAQEHYAIEVYDAQNNLVKNSYLYRGYSLSAQEGKSPQLKERQAKLYREELTHYPDNYEAKLRLLAYEMEQAPDDQKPAILQKANDVIAQNFYSNPGNMRTANLSTMGYLIMGENSRLDSLYGVIKKNYPQTEAGYELRISEIRSLADTVAKVTKLEDILRQENAKNASYLTSAHEALFNHYTLQRNPQKALHHLGFLHNEFTPYTPKNLQEQAILLFENNIALDTALALAQRALTYADTFPVGLIRYFPETGYLPSFVTRERRAQSEKEATGQLTSLMALILQKQGKDAESETYMAQAVSTSTDEQTLKNAARFYSLSKNFERAFQTYRQLAAANPEDSASFHDMKQSYQLWKGNDRGLDAHVHLVEETWAKMTAEEIEKELISTPLPDVLAHFVDLKGNAVDQNLIRNKIVVMDFWATWCIPCMKAMPSMNKVYRRYQNDSNVVFMIVNSGARNELTDAQNWWGNEKFDFPVYYNKDRTIGEKLGFNLIPATYVIDSNGIIRFKTIGFEGEGLERKLTARIEMLKGDR